MSQSPDPASEANSGNAVIVRVWRLWKTIHRLWKSKKPSGEDLRRAFKLKAIAKADILKGDSKYLPELV